MALELINAATSVATLILLGASVTAAIVQLRHMRASNELQAVLAVENDFRSAELQAALSYVQDELPGRLRDPVYRTDLSSPGYVDPSRHPEMALCNWFNAAGALVYGGFLNEEMFLASFGRLVEYYWQGLGPVVALLRRSRGPGQYQRFEYLAYRAQRRRTAKGERRTGGLGAGRLGVTDPWLAGDEAARG